MARLCLCVNQVARLRNLNKDRVPDPASVAIAAELGGVDGIVAELRDDRSDITDRDVSVLKEVVQSHLNLAIPLTDEMVKKALKWLPDMVTLLPAIREVSLNTSLDVVSNLEFVEDVAAALRANNIVVNVLIDPDPHQVRAAAKAHVDYIHLNSNPLRSVEDLGTMSDMIERIRSIAAAANKLGMGVSTGRGLNMQNIRDVADISYIEELNVGRALVARSILVGVEKAIEQMKKFISA